MPKNSLYLLLFILLSSCLDMNTDSSLSRTFKHERVIPNSKLIKTGEGLFHYVYTDQGMDHLAVFVHGSPGSWEAFEDYFRNDTLLQNFDLLSVDRLGYGQSGAGHAETSLKKQSAAIAKAISQYDSKKIILVGHSLGGSVVAQIAMDYPDLVSALVLVAPSIDPNQEKEEWYRSWIDTKILGAIVPTSLWVSNKEILDLKPELENMLPLWREISVPVIVIQGTKDMLVPKENAEFARAMVSDSLVDIRYLNGVNHFIPWTNPEQILQALWNLKE